HFRWSSPSDTLGCSNQGLQNQNQQAYQLDDRTPQKCKPLTAYYRGNKSATFTEKRSLHRPSFDEESADSSGEQRQASYQDLVTSFDDFSDHDWFDDCGSQRSPACACFCFRGYGWSQVG